MFPVVEFTPHEKGAAKALAIIVGAGTLVTSDDNGITHVDGHPVVETFKEALAMIKQEVRATENASTYERMQIECKFRQ